jgi:hypothetical protein
MDDEWRKQNHVFGVSKHLSASIIRWAFLVMLLLHH